MAIALKAYAAVALTFLILDGLWLGVIARDWLAKQLGALKRDRFLLVPAVGFYLLYMAGLVMFAVLPAVGSGGWMRAGLLGGCLGLVAYGTYDLTNLATLKNWSRAMTVVDILWGGAVSAATAAGACFLVML
jgi:uncharacterized membrane protein